MHGGAVVIKGIQAAPARTQSIFPVRLPDLVVFLDIEPSLSWRQTPTGGRPYKHLRPVPDNLRKGRATMAGMGCDT